MPSLRKCRVSTRGLYKLQLVSVHGWDILWSCCKWRQLRLSHLLLLMLWSPQSNQHFSPLQKSTSGFGSIQVTMFLSNQHGFFCVPGFFVSQVFCVWVCRVKDFQLLYRQPLLNSESWESPTHKTRWVQLTDHPCSSVSGAVWAAVRLYEALLTTRAALTYCIVYLTSRLLPLSG